MKDREHQSRHALFIAICIASGLTLSGVACSSDGVGGIAAQAGSGATENNDDPSLVAGSGNVGTTAGTGGTSTTPEASGGSASEPNAGSGGAPSAGSGGTPSTPETCMFHTEPAPDVTAGAGGDSGSAGATGDAGAGGAAEPVYDIVAESNAVVGEYLADKNGYTLYTYGNDLPGDCNNAPVSNCLNDCLKQWPVFDAGPRILDPKLSDGVFGRFLRSDGVWQTTFHGWPLYNYVDRDGNWDEGVAGQGRGKTWHIAETATPTIMIMKQPGREGIRYLADWKGRTLYTFAEDIKGSESADPVSACTGSCGTNFRALTDRSFSAVPSLEPSDFSMFAREGIGLHISYKGAPLYFAVSDDKPGTFTGTETAGFAVAVP